MKTTSAILKRAAVLSAALTLACSVQGAQLFSEKFDLQAEARIETNNGADGVVTFVDYSAMTVGALVHNIPEAPRQIAGSAATKGLLLQVLYTNTASASERIVNVLPLDDVGGSRLAFTDNYRLSFDAYLRLSPSVTLAASGLPSNPGTTEQLLWGVGYAPPGDHIMGRNYRTFYGSGVWGYLATEGGFNATATGGDAGIWVGAGGNAFGSLHFENAGNKTTYFTPAFGSDATPVPHCPANQWVQVDISVLAGQVTVEYQAVGADRAKTKFYENVAGTVAGSVMVGYEDSFMSVSFDPDNQWMLLDNMVVEDLALPTLLVAAAAPFPTFMGTPTTGTFNVTNTRTAGDLTVSAVTFTGAGAPDFSLATPLPLVVAAGATQPLNITFNPSAPNGVRTISLTIVSDDPETPNFVISNVRARRSVGSFFEAHYKLDETAGTAVTDSSGNGVNGAFTVRTGFPLSFGQPTLLGPADPGTAIGFTPAQSSAEGNYFTSSVVHTPTFSISLWMKPLSTGRDRTLWQRDYDSLRPYDKIYGLLLLADGTLTWNVRGTPIIPAAGDPPLPVLAEGDTHHIVLTHLDTDGFGNDTAIRSRLYIDGLLVAEKSGEGTKGFDDYPLNPVNSTLHVASRTIANYGYSGDIDDFQVYGAELTREQVWEIYKRAGGSATQEWRVLSAARSGSPPTFDVTFPSSPGGTYQLFRSLDLQTWLPAADAAPGMTDSLTTSLADPSPPAGHQYYRVLRN